jgi:hypothetical protein
MEFPTGEEIRGTFADAISKDRPARIPGQVRAFLSKTTTTQYSTDSDTVGWFLERFEEI